MTDAATTFGEARHETCRFGTLNPAWVYGGVSEPTPSLIPICSWKPCGPHPPALSRAWGGAVEFDRDCAVCNAHKPVEIAA